MSAPYAHPEVLVNTDWVAAHAKDANVRVVEVDVDTKAYDEGHVPGRDCLGLEHAAVRHRGARHRCPRRRSKQLLTQSGIGNDTTVVLYGDNNNWFAAWAFWQMKIYGHQDVRIMDGGRKKWLAEGRDLDTAAAKPTSERYTLPSHRTGLLAACVSAAGAAGAEIRECGDDRRAQSAGIHRRNSGASRIARNLPARRPHSGRAQRPLGQSLQRRWNVQVGRTSSKSCTAPKASSGPSR